MDRAARVVLSSFYLRRMNIMAMGTLERAYFLARSGACRDVDGLEQRLKADGCRAVEALLATRSVRAHLAAICAATFKPSRPA
jgi:hypothetical protein